jgi:hypothetical protein
MGESETRNHMHYFALNLFNFYSFHNIVINFPVYCFVANEYDGPCTNLITTKDHTAENLIKQ